MTVEHQENATKGEFFIQIASQKLAKMTYSKAGEKLIIIDHTQVEDALRGKGAGNALVEKAVDWARAHDVKIIALCPFALSVFRKNEQLRDVLK